MRKSTLGATDMDLPHQSSDSSRTGLVGRELEASQLITALGEVGHGRGTLFLLVGEPGIGKTRLANEVSRRARERGFLVAWGAAWDGGGAPAYWPWKQVLRSLAPFLPAPGEALRRDLGPLWDDENAPADEDPDSLQFRRCDALRAVLGTALCRQPLVVVLDDLHAADRATLLALYFVARALPSLPLLLVGTHRDCDARLRPDASALLAKIAREGTTLALGPLGTDAVRSWLSGLEPLPARVAERIQALAGGNPFFVEEILRLLQSGAPLDRVPDGVRMLVRERLERLDPAARGLLQTLSVLGHDTPRGDLAKVSGLDAGELDEHLRVPRLAGIVEDAGDDALGFRHPLFRECLYDGIGPLERRKLHLLAGRVLTRAEHAGVASAESGARHLLLALPLGELGVALERARTAAVGCRRALAFDRSVELLERALSALADVEGAEAARADLELELAEVLVFVGQGEQSRALCSAIAARALARSDGIRFTRAALAYGAEIRVGMQDPVQVELLERAETLLGDSEQALRSRVMARLAAARLSKNPEEPVALAHRAIDLARSTGDPDTLLQALHMGGAALVCYSSLADRRDHSQELAELALARKEFVLAQRGYQRWAIDALELGDRDEMAGALSAEAKLGHLLGHARFRWKGALFRSELALIEGRWADSRAAIAEASALVAETDEVEARMSLAIHRMGAVRARMLAPGESFDDDAETLALRSESQFMRGLVEAAAWARADELERARAAFTKVVPVPAWVDAFPSAVLVLAELAERLNDAALAARALRLVMALPFPALSWGAVGFVWDGFLAHALGGLEFVLGRFDSAISRLETAVAEADRFGARPNGVESRILLARALLSRGAAGDAKRADELLLEARPIATELELPGSLQRIDRCRSEQPLLGQAAPEPNRAFTFELNREGEVWAVHYCGKTSRLKHSRAIELLKQLTDAPGREFHVLELGDAEAAALIGASDAGALLDPHAKTAYSKRIAELRAELDESDRWNDGSRRDRLRAVLEFLEDELGRGVALGGRLRRSGGAAERARVNVQKRLRGVIERVAGDLPELAQHLQASIKTGLFVSYQPDTRPRHRA